MQNQVIFVTGASRGLGLELVTDYLKYENTTVIAAARNPKTAEKLQALKNEFNDKLAIVQLDVTDEKSIEQCAQATIKLVDHIDLLVNNAGIVTQNHPVDNALQATKSAMLSVFETNVTSVVLVTQALFPLLQAAKKLREKERVLPKVISISSNLASITNNFGGLVSYRASKAALNMVVKTFSMDNKDDAIFLALSPGWVATDMGSKGGRAPPLTTEISSSGMRKVIDNLTPDDNGKFIEYDGSNLPW